MTGRSSEQELLELGEAGLESDVPNMTGMELNDLFKLPLKEDGHPDTTEFINACLHVQTCQAVIDLPHDQRIRAVRSAAAILGFYFSPQARQ